VKSHDEEPCNSARIAEGFLPVSSECDYERNEDSHRELKKPIHLKLEIGVQGVDFRT